MSAEFHHVFEPSAGSDTTLLLLHGTGGDERDLLPLGRTLLPGAALLSPRGKILEHGMPRFFARLSEGVFDEADLRERAGELAQFVDDAVNRYEFDRRRVIAVGFSNGANIASAVLLLHPGVLAGAVLFRAMVPLMPATPPDLSGTGVLISNGQADPLIAADETERLTALLRRAGAQVTLEWQRGGHQLTERDVTVARAWLARDRPDFI